MKYREKIASLATYARTRLECHDKSDKFEIRVDDKDDDYLRVLLFMRNENGEMERTGAMVTVSVRPANGSIRLSVELNQTFCCRYSDETIAMVAGFLALEHIGRVFYERTKGEVYEV